MILNDSNTIYKQSGATTREQLVRDKALIYRSPSRIKIMGYAGEADRIVESSTIDPKYFKALTKMKAQISLGSTGTGEDKEYKNVHLYSEKAIFLDGIERIGYLYQDENVLKICEYKKGTRGSRYSSLYTILKNKLENNEFEKDDESFIISLENLDLFVEIINEICEERNNDKYCLVKSSKIDELKPGIFNVAYWNYKDKVVGGDNKDTIIDLDTYRSEITKSIDMCNDLDELRKIESDLETMLGFCNSKIKVLKMLSRK